MSRMIPPVLHSSCRSGGEKRLFRVFMTDSRMKDWVVMHSLNVARHPQRISGELDFVVFVPGEGVLCLEVKSGQVTCKDGMWHFPYGRSPRGPFAQCAESMHAMKNWLFDSDPDLRRTLVTSAVVFTDVDLEISAEEWYPWQQIGYKNVKQDCSGLANACLGVLRNAHATYSRIPSAGWYHPQYSRPNVEMVQRMANLLRPDFEFFQTPIQQIAAIDSDIRFYTEEQFQVLDMVADYPRAGFIGPAGTGKTLIAIETFRREIENGRSAALFCYNDILGNWLQEQTKGMCERAGEGKQAHAGSLHQYLTHLDGDHSSLNDSVEDWRDQNLPAKICSDIIEGHLSGNVFDTLVLDEAQDLRRKEFLDVLDLLLVRGLKECRFYYFGDFERQSIYGLDEPPETWNHVTENVPPPLKLARNCRNSMEIKNYIELLCQLDPPYAHSTLNVTVANPKLKFYFDSNDEQQTILKNTLEELLKDDFPPQSIVILSMRTLVKSCACKIRQSMAYILRPIETGRMHPDCINYTSIQEFKGMESPIIVVTDINTIDDEQARALLYIAMSRARQRLYLICNETCRASLKNILRKRGR